MLFSVTVAVLPVKLLGPVQLQPIAPAADAEMVALAFWHTFGTKLIATGDVATTETLLTAVLLHTNVVCGCVNKAVAV